MVTFGEKYMERVQKALIETAVLGELNRDGTMSREDLVRRVRGMGFHEEKLIRDSLRRLDRDGHVQEREGRIAITQDGREDVRRIEGQLCCVAASEVAGVNVPDQYRPGTYMGPEGP